MAGRPQEAPGGRPVVVCVRLSNAEAAAMDRQRGSLSRTMWLRWLVIRKIKEQS